MSNTMQDMPSIIPFPPSLMPKNQTNAYLKRDFRNEADFRLRHHFDYCNGLAVEKDRDAAQAARRPNKLEQSRQAVMQSMQQSADITKFTEAGTRFDPNKTSSLPSYVVYDRKCLRFYAYYQEPVHESQQENYRIHKCAIFYYLEDDSIHVSEPTQENSGMPQGVMLRRHNIPKEDGQGFYHCTDLNIGNEVTFYGKTFRIVDCDQATRAYMTETLGLEVPDREPYPEDFYMQIRESEKKFKKPGGPPKPKNDLLIAYTEAKLGRATNVLQDDTLAQFLKCDRQVLRFFCLWDDRDNLYGEVRKFVVHFFLADDTVEILEVYEANSGRDQFPALLRRCRLFKDYKHFTSLSGDTKSAHQVRAHDLYVGATLEALNRKFLLYGCDEFTRNWYKQSYGWDMQDMELPKEPTPKQIMEIPPHNGFGLEEDSLQNVLHLMPQAPKKNFHQIMENDRKLLRFEGFFDPTTVAAEDVDRRFIITVYLADDTIAVYEPPERNSGIIGGKFLERGVIKKPGSDERYLSTDFFIGAEVEFHKHRFRITSCDLYTLEYMEANKNKYPMCDIDSVMAYVGNKKREGKLSNHGMQHEVEPEVFQDWLKKNSVTRAAQEDLTIMRAYTKQSTEDVAFVDFKRFWEDLDKS
eukprot:Rmarinus@m.20098